jgi:hypothetical protein
MTYLVEIATRPSGARNDGKENNGLAMTEKKTTASQ